MSPKHDPTGDVVEETPESAPNLSTEELQGLLDEVVVEQKEIESELVKVDEGLKMVATFIGRAAASVR